MWFLIALAVVGLLLALPVDLRVALDSRPGGRRAAQVRWAFGLIRIGLRRRAARRPERPRPTRRRSWPSRRIRAGLSAPGLPGTLARRLGRLIGSARIRALRLRAEFGTGDPAETGILFGLAAGALAAAPPLRPPSLALIPDFEVARARLWLRGEARVIPAVMLGHLLALVFAPAVMRAAFRMIRA